MMDVKKKIKHLGLIDCAILIKMKNKKAFSSKEMKEILKYPTHKNVPPISKIMQELRAKGLLKYNKKTKKYQLTVLSNTIIRKIEKVR